MSRNPEYYLISSVINNEGHYSIALEAGIKDEHFHDLYDEWVWIGDYWSKFKRCPTRRAFIREFPRFTVVDAVDDTPHFVEEVKTNHVRQLLLEGMSNATDLISVGDLDKAVNAFNGIATRAAQSIGKIRDVDIIDEWETAYQEAVERRRRFQETGTSGIKTGLETYDEITGGLQPTELTVIGARLGEGKSFTMQDMATDIVLKGHKVHFSALEMSLSMITMRMHNLFSMKIGTPDTRTVFEAGQLRKGTEDYSLVAYKQFLRDLKRDVRGRLTISDSSSVTIPEIRAQIERHEPDVFFLDYIQLLARTGEWQDVGRAMTSLLEIAKDYNVAIVMASQLNREAANGRIPSGAENISQSDQIGHTADTIITAKRLSKRVTVYKMAKNRHGNSGQVWYTVRDYAQGVKLDVDRATAETYVTDDEIEDGIAFS